ncbi:MAG TPA: pyridoxal-dependent decarboxylase [Lapillicoccus sp.]|nr:pyridoxal-dependent decarboxylase [Lapillicoccus sp.]
MASDPAQFEKPLALAHASALEWLGSLDRRPVGPQTEVEPLLAALDGGLPDAPSDPTDVVELMVRTVDPGLMAIQSGRFFGWVMGGTLPAALAADWLVSAWDQNAGMRSPTPGVVALEETAGTWFLDLLGLPGEAAVSFTTGATMANLVGLAAARHAVLAGVGWDVEEHGLAGAPPVHVLAGAERHDSVDLALRYLGFGAPTLVAADEEGRMRVDALAAALDGVPDGEAVIVVLQAGNLHSGAFDPFAALVPTAHARGAWVHVDGAFGLWAAVSPRLAPLVAGMAEADSWATDAHKTLNVTYDCGIAAVRDRAALRGSFAVHAHYLASADPEGPGNPYERVPEMSRRARGVPVWAALRSLGRSGVGELVERLATRAAALAEGVRTVPGAEVLNDVVYTQVCFAFEDDARTAEVGARLVADGRTWISGSRWRDRGVLRISVSNWTTDESDVEQTVAALRRAATG